MKKLAKLLGCKDECKCAAKEPCTTNECYQQQYEVTVVLGPSFINEESGRYFFAFPTNGEYCFKVSSSATNEVTFTVTDTYYIRHLISTDDLVEVRIKKVVK